MIEQLLKRADNALDDGIMIEHAEAFRAVKRRARLRPEQDALVLAGRKRNTEFNMRAKSTGEEEDDQLRFGNTTKLICRDFALALRRLF